MKHISIFRKVIATIMLLVILPCVTQAQLFDKLKKKVNDVLNKKTDKKADDVPDGRKSGQPSAAAEEEKNTTAAAKEDNKTINSSKSLEAYQNYDFVPGDKIVIEDNFAEDEIGEFPAHWGLLTGQGTLNMVEGKKSLLLSSGATFVKPLIKNPTYLTDTFTLEFDHYCKSGYGPVIYFYNNDNEIKGREGSVGYIDFASNNGWSFVYTFAQGEEAKWVNLPDAIRGENYCGKWHHIAMICKNKKLKVYIDQNRIIALPEFNISPKAFAINASGYPDSPMVFANIRVANGGGMKTSEKKFTDSKIVAHINFDVDKSSIKPESMGILNGITEVLKNNPDLKFDIQGHTDNTGEAAHNLSMSQQRADAVKKQLISMRIDEARLTTKGMGDTKPVSDNGILEGIANNTRVEFVTIK
jgi:OmpA-OmpF porin, OOP family